MRGIRVSTVSTNICASRSTSRKSVRIPESRPERLHCSKAQARVDFARFCGHGTAYSLFPVGPGRVYRSNVIRPSVAGWLVTSPLLERLCRYSLVLDSPRRTEAPMSRREGPYPCFSVYVRMNSIMADSRVSAFCWFKAPCAPPAPSRLLCVRHPSISMR